MFLDTALLLQHEIIVSGVIGPSTQDQYYSQNSSIDAGHGVGVLSWPRPLLRSYWQLMAVEEEKVHYPLGGWDCWELACSLVDGHTPMSVMGEGSIH